MENHRLISALVIGGLLGISGCSDTCSSWWSCPNAGTVDTDMGVPPGSAPYVKWSPARVPIGAPTIEVLAGRASDATVTLEQINKSSISVNVTKRTNNNDGTWWLTLETQSSSWTTLSAGTANLVLSNKDGSGSSELIFVKPAFSMPASSVPSAGTQWLSFGSVNGQSSVFGMDVNAQSIWAVGYQPGKFTTTSRTEYASGLELAALSSLLNINSSVFFAISAGSPPQDLTRYRIEKVGKSYVPSTLLFGKAWSTDSISAMAAGSLDGTTRLLLAVATSAKLYTCVYTGGMPDSGQVCVPQSPSLPSKPEVLLVRTLDKTGLPQVVALGSGAISIYASDASGTLMDRTSAAGLANPSKLDLVSPFLATGDVDGDGSIDLVGVSSSSVVVFINNGSGVFRRVETSIGGLTTKFLTLGDVDKDGQPDVLISAAPKGKVLVLLNASDRGLGNGRFVGPADVGMEIGTGGVLALDGQDTPGTGRRLVWQDSVTAMLNVADNVTMP